MRGLPRIYETIKRRLYVSGEKSLVDVVHAAEAAFNLGLLLREQDDTEGARAAYEQAVGSNHPDYAPRAVFNLGNLLQDQGDLEKARVAYQVAIDSVTQRPLRRR